MGASEADHDHTVQQYYDQNTRRFLRIGGSAKIMTIHRAVWLPGIRTRQEALQATNKIALAEARDLQTAQAGETLRVLDLGCGVGGTLFALAHEMRGGTIQCDGVTLSPVQAQMAASFAKELELDGCCAFHTASYLKLPALPPADFAVAIESFVLGPDPERFFASAAGALRRGGRLLVIDDFLSERSSTYSAREQRWIDRFRAGWGARSLIPHQIAVQQAEGAGFSVRANTDLTHFLRLLGARDQIVRIALLAGRVLPLRQILGAAYWGSLDGGDALQYGLKHRLIEYRALVLEKM